MPTSLKRYSVSIPDEVAPLVERDRRKKRIPTGTFLAAIIVKHYGMELGQTVMFGRARRPLVESQRVPLVVFQAPSQPETEQSSSPRALPGEAKI